MHVVESFVLVLELVVIIARPMSEDVFGPNEAFGQVVHVVAQLVVVTWLLLNDGATCAPTVGEIQDDEGVNEDPEERGEQYDATVVQFGARDGERVRLVHWMIAIVVFVYHNSNGS